MRTRPADVPARNEPPGPARLERLPYGHPSSPYNDDGTRKPPVVDLKSLELPVPADDAPEDALPDSPPPADTKHEPNDWQAALPALKAAWQAHLDRWPHDEQVPVNKVPGEAGSWQGDSGQRLSTGENFLASRELDRVRSVEHGVSYAMREVEATVPGTKLVGYEYRIKSENRYKEKLSDELHGKPNLSMRQITDSMPDALRYTCQLDSETYVDSLNKVSDRLRQHGYQLEFSRNSWNDSQYKGINTRWRTPEGPLFEVQFHTAESFEGKQLTHAAYERIRSPQATDLERDELHAFQAEVSSHIPEPEGARTIPNYRKSKDES